MQPELYIVLGCFGRSDDGFISCGGLRNRILHLHPSDPNYTAIMDFLDGMQLFDRLMLDFNAVRRFVYNMQERFSYSTQKLWSEKMYHIYEKFIISHKDCGVFIDLELAQ